MNECRVVIERLASYADGSLEDQQRLSVEQHLAACPSCRYSAALETGGRALLRRRAVRLGEGMVLPPGLRSRCEAIARDLTATPAVATWRSRLVPLSLAVVLMIFSASAFLSLATHRNDGLLAAQLSRDHAWCFKRFAGVTGADAGAMERMLNDLYGWRVHVPPSSAADGIQLIGAKRCYYSGGAVPHILYRVNGQQMSLYVLDGKHPPTNLVAAGHRSRVWSRDDKTYVLVSPVSAGEMAVATSYVMQDAH
jgi:anti-sigma factor RsiW